MALKPDVLWAQREDSVFLTIDLKEVQDMKITLDGNLLSFSGTADGNFYELKIEFYAAITKEESKYGAKRLFEFYLKKVVAENWPRLPKEKGKYPWLKVDWKKWQDSDDEGDKGDFNQDGLGEMNFGDMGGGEFDSDGKTQREERKAQRASEFMSLSKARFGIMSKEELARLTVPYADSQAFRLQLRWLLDEHGVAVVSEVLTGEELIEFDHLKVSEVDLSCHGEFAWQARLHRRVRGSFEAMYGTHDVSCSADMMRMFYTPKGQPVSSKANHQWLHIDQNEKTGLTHRCYQGILYVWSSEGESSTTAVWPGSHGQRGHDRVLRDSMADDRAQWRDESGVKCGHFLPLSEMQDVSCRDELIRDALHGTRRMPIPAGSLLLWDSRAIHQGWHGGPRLAVPVCWEPRERVSQEARSRKLNMVFFGLASTHSPSEGRVHPNEKKMIAQRPAIRPYATRPQAELTDAEWDELWPPARPETVVDAMSRLPPRVVALALRPEIADVL